MNKRLAWHAALAGSLIGALALAGCGDDDDPDNGDLPDSGVNDSGVVNDAGPQDSGVPDAGMVDVCPDNTEGCDCVSDVLQSQLIQQDTCETGLICVPWDVLSDRAADFTGPFQSCARPCDTDADCGAGRVCSANGLFNEDSGLSRFCADAPAALDNRCSFSKLPDAQFPVVPATLGRSVGCAGGHTCQIGFFNDLHPSEGICFDACEEDADCAGLTDTPVCNPRVFRAATGTAALGVCQANLPQAGDLCFGPGSEFNFTRRCDTTDSPMFELACLRVDGLLEAGTGQCWSVCEDPDEQATVCPDDPELGPQGCFPGVFNNGAGLCNVGCGSFGDICEGPGTNGLGRVCESLTLPDEPDNPFSQCVNRIGPPLMQTLVNPDGTVVLPVPDVCDDPNTPPSNDVYRCPDPTSCIGGVCVVGCETSTAAPGSLTCADLTNVATSTCVPPDPAFLAPGLGLCAGL